MPQANPLKNFMRGTQIETERKSDKEETQPPQHATNTHPHLVEEEEVVVVEEEEEEEKDENLRQRTHRMERESDRERQSVYWERYS